MTVRGLAIALAIVVLGCCLGWLWRVSPVNTFYGWAILLLGAR